MDERHSGNFYKLDDIQKAKALFAMYQGKAKDAATKLQIWKCLLDERGSGTEEENDTK